MLDAKNNKYFYTGIIADSLGLVYVILIPLPFFAIKEPGGSPAFQLPDAITKFLQPSAIGFIADWSVKRLARLCA
ncbi:hypothetical protein HC891_04085 [Candidatus Gracilibacteria bacterium]|nr:hypothetical protein [Candidatus Gracilibacteria bacterium]